MAAAMSELRLRHVHCSHPRAVLLPIAPPGLCQRQPQQQLCTLPQGLTQHRHRTAVSCAAGGDSRKKRRKASQAKKGPFKGFSDNSSRGQSAVAFDEDEEAPPSPPTADDLIESYGAEQGEDEEEDGEQLYRSEYQAYTDPDYVPPRFLGQVAVSRPVEGRGRSLVASGTLLVGELLAVSPALFVLEGQYGEPPPEAEDLHTAWLEEGLSAAQRRVLDLLYDGTPESLARPASASTLDAKFWAARGRSDSAAPAIDAGRLLRIIQECACADNTQDTATMQMRHQVPSPFIGVWPEYALLDHSCVPNVSLTVIKDRLFVHAATVVEQGETLTRNYLPHLAGAPRSVRRAALREQYGFDCRCRRCQLEASVPEQVTEALEDTYAWFTHEATPQWEAAEGQAGTKVYEALMSEAKQMVDEVEAAVAAAAVSEEDGVLLRASAWDAYDLLVMCQELVHGSADPGVLSECLMQLREVQPGSDAHTSVAVKLDELSKAQRDEAQKKANRQLRNRRLSKDLKQELDEAMQGAQFASLLLTDAFAARYGALRPAMLRALREAQVSYLAALQQLGAMQAQGMEAVTRQMDINGVTVNIVDAVDVATARRHGNFEGADGDEAEDEEGGGGGAGGWEGDEEGERAVEVQNKDGTSLVMVEQRRPRRRGAAAAS